MYGKDLLVVYVLVKTSNVKYSISGYCPLPLQSLTKREQVQADIEELKTQLICSKSMYSPRITL